MEPRREGAEKLSYGEQSANASGNVYDVTDFVDVSALLLCGIAEVVRKLSLTWQEHPGGADIILQYAGKDATEEYEVSPLA